MKHFLSSITLLVPIFALFHHDKLSAELFQLDYLEKILEPNDLIEFLATNFNTFEDDTVTISPTYDFVRRASKYFDIHMNSDLLYCTLESFCSLNAFRAPPQAMTSSNILLADFSWKGAGLKLEKFSKSVKSDS